MGGVKQNEDKVMVSIDGLCLVSAAQYRKDTHKLSGGAGRPSRQWGQSPCPVRRGCRTEAGSAGRRDGFGGIQRHPWHRWMSHSWALHSGVWWEGESQQHKLKHKRLRLEIRWSLSPMRTAQWWRQGPGRLGCLQPWEVAHPGWVKPWAAWSEPTADPQSLPASLSLPVCDLLLENTGEVPGSLPAPDSLPPPRAFKQVPRTKNEWKKAGGSN